MKTCLLYELIDDSGECRYIGITRRPDGREAHWKTARPELSMRALVCGLDLQAAVELEQKLIRRLRDRGQALLNCYPAAWISEHRKAWVRDALKRRVVKTQPHG